MTADLTFEFRAPVLKFDTGVVQHYLPVPAEFADQLRVMGLTTLECTVNGTVLRRTLYSGRDGDDYVIVGKSVLRSLGVRLGEFVDVQIRPHPDPDHVELGDELREVLELDDEAAERFYTFTPGMQRSLALYVNTAKREATRIKRALEIAEKVRTNTLYGDRNP